MKCGFPCGPLKYGRYMRSTVLYCICHVHVHVLCYALHSLVKLSNEVHSGFLWGIAMKHKCLKALRTYAAKIFRGVGEEK